MEKLVMFSNENSDIKKTPVNIIVDYDRNVRAVKILNYFGKLRNYYAFDNKSFYDALSYAGYVLARTNIDQFYEAFSLIENPLEHEALLKGLNRAVDEYHQLLYNVKTVEGEYNGIPAIVPFYPFNKEINSLNNEFLKISNRIYLNESGRIEKIERREDTINSVTNVYEKRTDVERTDRISYLPLSRDAVLLSSRWLCQCNLEEYKKLLSLLNNNDRYYNLVVNSGATVAEDILKLERKCNH